MAGNVWECVDEPYADVPDGQEVARGGAFDFLKDMAFRLQGGGSEIAFGTPDVEDYSLYGGSVGQLDWLDPSGTGSPR